MESHSLKSCVSQFVRFPETDWQEIESRFRAVHLAKSEFLIQAGAPCRVMAFIERGFLRMYNLVDGKEITLWIGQGGSFITSLSSFVFETENHWTIQAVTDCELRVISREDHFRLLDQFPKWLAFDNHLLARSFALLEQSMFAHLHTTALQRLNTLMDSHPGIFLHVPHQHIATMIGVTPETLSRLRRQLAQGTS
ncbi:Crp/Fnr family transcriptional regulator [Pontibacter sp. G13]|uniref:Crp/Fnr family transcriptional regulator n=1 Tax=Pontibacter sp. G13 TaxID=3074898 RepID=UPI002889F103|nr:Crp/Fnr family transcriptional regulator [Pontibacter sp. G13]WNJ18768.1 Crp/Fnr family transcriptional regulator [Pontibacter sp. G13]